MPLTIDPAMLAQQAAQMQPAPVAAQTAPHGPESLWPYLALLGGQGADMGTTLAALSRGGREVNPMGPVGTLAAKAAATAALAWLMHHEHQQGNDKAQKIIGTLGGLMGGIPAAWNAHELTK